MVNFMRSAAGRVLGAALVLVVVISVLGLAASQTFINKTGKTVTGIKIEFSKQVLITRHDSVFPDQAPSGRSDEFTFDGGSLRNLGRFTVSWMPSSGKVMDYEWIEKAQPSEDQQSSTQQNEGSSLPDPNTPAILYGNNYPGPDEPQYQPAEDEQLWLTDLEGHGDIYDNDSIKINYAPGFDVSQIRKIEVYRNGIKLRFVPEKFDVLTNGQMKTFDGNAAEHSPASNHTDHAIMGYEYKFKILSADHVWILTKTVKSGFRWRPKEMWAQMDFNWMCGMERLSHDEMVEFFIQLRNDGFTGISFDIAYYMNSPYDNDVIEQRVADRDITWESITTATAREVEDLLRAIREARLEVSVRGYIYISQQYQDEHGPTFSGDIDPTNPQEFFDSYTRLWLKLVPLLNKYHVKLITPFVECYDLKENSELIKEMYTKISGQYDREMGFEEGTANILNGVKELRRLIKDITDFKLVSDKYTFWDWKDSRGRPVRIEYSCWTPPLETQKDQRVSVMAANFVKFWRPAVAYYSSTYPHNPEMFGELGVRNADGACLGPTYYDVTDKRLDREEVADIWYAYLKGANELGIRSINVWVIGLGDLWVMDCPGDSFINIGLRQPESPAYRIIKAIIAGN